MNTNPCLIAPPGGMTPDTISKILRVAMTAQYVCYGVLMTPIASIFQQAGRMARAARSRRTPRRFMIYGEAVRPVVCRRLPTAGVVAFGAVLAEHPLVGILTLMAGITGCESAFEYLIHMAGSTRHSYVFPR